MCRLLYALQRAMNEIYFWGAFIHRVMICCCADLSARVMVGNCAVAGPLIYFAPPSLTLRPTTHATSVTAGVTGTDFDNDLVFVYCP